MINNICYNNDLTACCFCSCCQVESMGTKVMIIDDKVQNFLHAFAFLNQIYFKDLKDIVYLMSRVKPYKRKVFGKEKIEVWCPRGESNSHIFWITDFESAAST